jgi:hypothetical protein
LKYKKLIHFVSTDDPIQVYQEYLEKEAVKKKAPRNRLAALNQSKVNDTMRFNDKEIETISSVSDSTNNNLTIVENTIISITKKSMQDELSNFRSKFKTITY